MASQPWITRTALQLYRDCLRLVRHTAPGNSRKGAALRQSLKMQFKANAHLQGEAAESCKAQAVRALSNYLVHESALKDPRMKKQVSAFHESQVKAAVALHKNSETDKRE
jgi:Complex 1 protein (LYR family)